MTRAGNLSPFRENVRYGHLVVRPDEIPAASARHSRRCRSGVSLIPQSIEFKGFPPSGPTDVDIYIKPDDFRQAFAADLPAKVADVMAAEQRPIALAAAEGQPQPPPGKRSPRGR